MSRACTCFDPKSGSVGDFPGWADVVSTCTPKSRGPASLPCPFPCANRGHCAAPAYLVVSRHQKKCVAPSWTADANRRSLIAAVEGRRRVTAVLATPEWASDHYSVSTTSLRGRQKSAMNSRLKSMPGSFNRHGHSGRKFGAAARDLQTLAVEQGTQKLAIASKGSFLDAIFQIERHNRICASGYRKPGDSPSIATIDIAEIYLDKTAQEIDEAMARVRQLNKNVLTYVCAVFAKRPDCEHFRSELPRANPWFGQPTYDLAVNDGSVTLR